MSLHLNLSTGKFLNSSTLFKLSDALLLDVSSGEIVMSNLLVPRAGVDLFKLASLDLNFAQRKSLTDKVSGNNLITFSRASSGTYVDSNGLIKTSPVNYKINSEEVNTFSLQQVTVTANQFEAPNSTLTADRVDITTAESKHSVTIGDASAIGTTVTASVYVKAISNVTEVQLIAAVAGGRGSAVFDLVNGTSENALAGNIIFIDSSIAPVGNDWYRISITSTSTGANSSVDLFFTDNNADALADRAGQTFVGTNESIAVWGAHFEEGTTATDYIPTGATISGAPRFDHDPVTGESLGLLIEEGRTNFFLNSDTLSTQSVTSTAVDYALSFYGTGTVTLSGNATGSLAGTGANERVSLVVTATAGTITATVAGTVENGQFEAGSFPSSYIPTTSSAVTRSPDIATIEGTNFSSWYNQSEGTVFSESRKIDPTSDSFVYSISDGSAANRIIHQPSAFALYVSNGGVDQASAADSSYSSGSFVKAGIGIKEDDFVLSTKGIWRGSGSSGTVPTVNYITIGTKRDYTTPINGHISRLAYFPTRKTDQELIDLTKS